MDNRINSIIIRINKLNKKEKIHILNILKTYNISFSKNTNGYFFNLSSLNDDIIIKIEKCLTIIEENRDLITEMDKKREDMMIYFKNLIEEKIKISISEKLSNIKSLLTIIPLQSNILLKYNKIINLQTIKNSDKDINLDMKIKYPKNSVYSNILSSIKLSKHNSQSKQHKVCEYQSNENIIDDVIDDNIDDDIDIIDDNIIGEFDIEIDDNVNVNDNDIINNIIKKTNIIDENNSDKDSDSDTSSISDKTNDETVIDEEFDNKIILYKKLLSNHGFKFDYDSCCFLIKEDYIL